MDMSVDDCVIPFHKIVKQQKAHLSSQKWNSDVRNALIDKWKRKQHEWYCMYIFLGEMFEKFIQSFDQITNGPHVFQLKGVLFWYVKFVSHPWQQW